MTLRISYDNYINYINPIGLLYFSTDPHEPLQTRRIRPAGHGHLASQPSPATLVQAKEIARREQIPVKFLEQILLALKNAGLLQSRIGVGGGYYLAKPADEITLGQIVRVLDGPLAPIRCVSKVAYEPCACPDEATCGLRLVMLDVRNAISNILDRTTLADVAHRVEQAPPLGWLSRSRTSGLGHCAAVRQRLRVELSRGRSIVKVYCVERLCN